MVAITRACIFIAMVILTIVSMCTTYLSLQQSVLPGPAMPIPIPGGAVWRCSVLALGLSVAIGMMLFALKFAIIDEQKKLNVVGVIGLTIVAFISIAFNMDVFYRWADKEFFLRYSTAQVKDTYSKYQAEVHAKLTDRKQELEKAVALQEGELESEILGLRGAPEGYGVRARAEDYTLTKLQKTTQVELASINEALAAKREADTLLASDMPQSLDEVAALQDKLRVTAKDAGAVVGVPLPSPVKQDNPLFAVFAKLFDLKSVGFKELFILAMSFFLDLGDIIGYSLVPNRPKRTRRQVFEAKPLFGDPEIIFANPVDSVKRLENANPDEAGQAGIERVDGQSVQEAGSTQPPARRAGRSRRAIRFRRF